MPLSRMPKPNVRRVTPYSGSAPTEPIAMPANSDRNENSSWPLAIARMQASPITVVAKNSGWSKVSAKRAKGGEAKDSSTALNRPPIALAVMAMDSARSGPSRCARG